MACLWVESQPNLLACGWKGNVPIGQWKGLQVFKFETLTNLGLSRKIEMRTQTHTLSLPLSLPAGQQTSSFPPLCTQFPPAGWPTWPVHRAGSLGWHHTVERFVTDVNRNTNKQWINTDYQASWYTQDTTRSHMWLRASWLPSIEFQIPYFKESCTDSALQS